MRELNWLNDLKAAKSLKEIQVKINLDDIKAIPGFYQASLVIDKILQCLKKFPKGIRSVSIQAEGLNIRKGHLCKIYRILGSFKKIERIQRVFGVMRGQDLVKREYGLARRYMRRCRYLKRFEYNPFGYQDDGYWMGFDQLYHPFHAKEDQKSFMGTMKERKMFEFVTNLKLPINTKYFTNYVHYERFLKELKDDQVSSSSSSSEDEGNSSEDEERIDAGTQKIIQDRNKNMMKIRLERGLLLFFRFELFPNLKSLKIDMNKKSLYYFTNSIIKSFGSLPHLESLEIALPKNPRSSKFLYKALLRLPLLSRFGLIMSTLLEEEAQLLLKFLERQTNLTSLMLNNDWIHVDEKSYRIQEDLIRNLGKYLARNKSLKDLSLLFGGSSMASLSASLRELGASWKNQMRALTLGFYDNTVSGSETVQGLCGFLENQGESLKSLFLEFNFIVNADALSAICQRITKLKQLRSLELYINEIGEPLKKTYIGFFKDTLKEKSPLALRPNVKGYKTWLVELARMLPKMENLEVLKLKVGRLTIFDEKFVREYLKVVESLRKIERLRNLSINIPFSNLKKEEKEEMKKGLLRLENVRNLVVEPFIGKEDEDVRIADDDILEIAELVNQRQATKHALLF